MTPETPPTAPARPRQLRAFAFLLALLALGAIGVVALRAPHRVVTGVPDDPAFVAVRERVHGRLAVAAGELRFVSSLLGAGGAPDVALATGAGRDLRATRMPWPADPRRLAAIAALDLAAHRYGEAERLYRRATELAPTYGEGRLGLGVTLALRAALEADEERARGLRMRAISQFAAVAAGDPAYEAALYDRALLLARIGRRDEARRRAAEYVARDPGSPWAVTLARELDVAPH